MGNPEKPVDKKAEYQARIESKVVELSRVLFNIAKESSNNPLAILLEYQFSTLGAIQRLSDIARATSMKANEQIQGKANAQLKKELEIARKKMIEKKEKDV